MDYREKSFLGFIKKTKLPWVYTWLPNIGFLPMLALVLYPIITQTNRSGMEPVLFVLWAFFGMKGFLYGTMYNIYKAGREAVVNSGAENIILLKDVEVYIKDFDQFGKTKFTSFGATIYDFENADIALTDDSLILNGKANFFGGEAFAYPATVLINGATSTSKATLKRWIVNGERIEITIADPAYKTAIRVDIKNEVDQIKQWLTENAASLKA
jgi:hypothetical protein